MYQSTEDLYSALCRVRNSLNELAEAVENYNGDKAQANSFFEKFLPRIDDLIKDNGTSEKLPEKNVKDIATDINIIRQIANESNQRNLEIDCDILIGTGRTVQVSDNPIVRQAADALKPNHPKPNTDPELATAEEVRNALAQLRNQLSNLEPTTRQR